MRAIGQVPGHQAAQVADVMDASGIRNKLEPEGSGVSLVWIYEEEEMDRARQLLQRFMANPDAAEFRHASRVAAEQRERERAAAEEAHGRFFRRDDVFRNREAAWGGAVTWMLIGLSVAVTVLAKFGANRSFMAEWQVSEMIGGSLFIEVRHGQVWRLLTPIFLHLDVMHLVFNMMWTHLLGAQIEARLGAAKLIGLVVVLGVASNVGQYVMKGPFFGGMSGVVYGLIGFIWMKSKLDPRSGLYLNPQSIALAIIWFALCFTGVLPVANTAHTVGLVLGLALGIGSAELNKRLSPR